MLESILGPVYKKKLALDIKQLKPMGDGGMGDEVSLVHLRINTWIGI